MKLPKTRPWENARLKLRTTTRQLADLPPPSGQRSDVESGRFVTTFSPSAWIASKIGCAPASLSRSFNELRPVGVATRDKIVVVRSISAPCRGAGATDMLCHSSHGEQLSCATDAQSVVAIDDKAEDDEA